MRNFIVKKYFELIYTTEMDFRQFHFLVCQSLSHAKAKTHKELNETINKGSKYLIVVV